MFCGTFMLFTILYTMTATVSATASTTTGNSAKYHVRHSPLSIKSSFAASHTDKLGRHGYHRFYDQFLQPLYGKPVRMVEIGVQSGFSLGAWQTMFDSVQSTIFGVGWPKIDEVKSKLDDNVRILFRDQSNCTHLTELVDIIGAPLDLVIDDGSHEPGHQLKTLVKLFPLLSPGGFYVLEDIECSYWDRPGSSIYGYNLTNVGVGKPGSIISAMKLLVEVINQRYAVRSYNRQFHIIDPRVDPEVSWVMFAQNMVVLRKRDAEDEDYQKPLDNEADESTWHAFWANDDVRALVNQIRASSKC